MARRAALLGFTALLAGGCLAIQSLDGYKVGGAGGAGGGGGAGDGGSAPCVTPGECAGELVSLVPNSGGQVRVTDIDFVEPTSGVVVVGVFTGTVKFAAQTEIADGRWDGFLLEVDGSGLYRNFRQIPEADEGSQLHVDFNEPSNQVAVGGTYTEAGQTMQHCPGSAGFFARLLDDNTSGSYDDAYVGAGPFCQQVTSANGDADAIAYDLSLGAGYVNIAGTFVGTIDGQTSTGIDGVSVGFELDGAPAQAAVFGGEGTQRLVGIANYEGESQNVVAGDFEVELVVAIPQDTPGSVGETFEAADDGRSLFVGGLDGFREAGQIALREYRGAAGIKHEMMALDFPPQMATARFAAVLGGDLMVNGEMLAAAPATGVGGVVVEFAAPPVPEKMAPPNEDVGNPVRHTALSADAFADLRVATSADGELHIGGLARGEVTVTFQGNEVTQIPMACALDFFHLTMDGADVVRAPQRCGDGTQTIGGFTWSDSNATWLSLNVGDELTAAGELNTSGAILLGPP